MGNLLSEVIVDGIVNGLHKINDIAVIRTSPWNIKTHVKS